MAGLQNFLTFQNWNPKLIKHKSLIPFPQSLGNYLSTF